VRLRWKTAAGAVVVVVAAALGGVAPAVSQAGPATATKDFSKPAIVILGYGLAPDGSMRAILRRRVMMGLIVAQFFPQSPIIVTGGNPQNGKTEAGQMRNMLMLLGFPADRIILEDKANSTVQNAQFSVPLAKEAGTSGIILVTSTTHQGRADGDFVDAGGNLLATVSGRELCWQPLMAGRTRSFPNAWGWRLERFGGGVTASRSWVWTGWSMSRGRAGRGWSAMTGSRR